MINIFEFVEGSQLPISHAFDIALPPIYTNIISAKPTFFSSLSNHTDFLHERRVFEGVYIYPATIHLYMTVVSVYIKGAVLCRHL